MSRITRRISAACILCYTSIGLAQAAGTSLKIPNEFTAGTPAKSAQVNANFSAVAAAVNANSSNISSMEILLSTVQKELASVQKFLTGAAGAIYVQSGATPVGAMVPMWLSESPFDAGQPATDYSVFALNSKGFFVALTSQGTLAKPLSPNTYGYDLFFTGTDCSGSAYFGSEGSEPAGQISLLLSHGIVFGSWTAGDPNTSYYAKGGVTVTVSSAYQPLSTGLSCENFGTTPPAIYGAPVLPNDPATTGVPASLSGPLTLTVH